MHRTDYQVWKGVWSHLLFYRSWRLFWSFVLLVSSARDYPHVRFMWPIPAIKSNWWDKEPDVGWRRRLMWQLEIVRMRRGKSLVSSHSFTHSLITSPSSSSSPLSWWTGPPHSAPGYTYRDVTLVRIPPSVAQ